MSRNYEASSNATEAKLALTSAPALPVHRGTTSTKGNTSYKKRAVTPKNTNTYPSENLELKQSSAKLNKPDPAKAKLMIKHTNVDMMYISEHEFPRAGKDKWNDPKWIVDLNKWRAQTFDRLFHHDDAYKSKIIRPKWSREEGEWFVQIVCKHGRKYGGTLRGKDWERISKAHEVRFVGTTIRKGDELITGKTAKTEQVIRRRNATSLRAMFKQMPELGALLQKTIDEFSDAEVELDTDEEGIAELSDDEQMK